MNSLKQNLLILLAACTALVGARAAALTNVDAAYKRLDPKIRVTVESYLMTDCELGEEGGALKKLLAVGPAARPYLVAVQREGPPSPVTTRLAKDLDTAWKARQKFLKTPEARALGEQSFQMMKAITKQQYESDQRAALQAKYRERVAQALKAMGNP